MSGPFVLIDCDHQGADAVRVATLAHKRRPLVLKVLVDSDCPLLNFHPPVVVIAKSHLVPPVPAPAEVGRGFVSRRIGGGTAVQEALIGG